jgi:hypothetical protein
MTVARCLVLIVVEATAVVGGGAHGGGGPVPVLVHAPALKALVPSTVAELDPSANPSLLGVTAPDRS